MLEKNGERIAIAGMIPANTNAVLRMPNGEEKELGNGTFSIEC